MSRLHPEVIAKACPGITHTPTTTSPAASMRRKRFMDMFLSLIGCGWRARLEAERTLGQIERSGHEIPPFQPPNEKSRQSNQISLYVLYASMKRPRRSHIAGSGNRGTLKSFGLND